jgi:hypothetical protein
MGREIVYCEGCGRRLTEDDFRRGKAQDHDNRPFCSDCRPVTAPPPAPPAPKSEGRGTERRSGTGVVRRRGATERVPLAQAPGPPPRPSDDPGNSRVAFAVGGGLAVLVLIVIAVANRGGEPPPEPVVPAARTPEHRPSALELAEERLRELEAFATPSADPQAVLARCEPLRAALRDTPLESRLKRVEAAAQDRLKEREFDRALAAVRKIIAEDAAYARRAEVEALLDAAARQAGPRLAEVQRLQSEYRRLWDEESKRREAAKKPARPWSDLFLQATARIQANDYPGAKTLYLEGLATLPEKRPDDITQRAVYCIGLYNLACIYSVEAAALAGPARRRAVDDAVQHLDRALRSDYGRFRCPCHPQTLGLGHMADDKDLEAVRADPRYAELAKKYR